MEAVGELGGLRLDRERSIDEIGSGYTYFANGDIVVAKITPCFENGKVAVAAGLINGVAFGTTELHVMRPLKRLDVRFLFYVTLSDSFRKHGEAYMYGAGGQKRVPEIFIKNFRVMLPPLPEQRAIAAFLDERTARIDALIAKKRRLLELLDEKRRAVITRAVTRGLDPTVPMKDTGIPWLGEVPVHWKVATLGKVAAVQSGLTLGKKHTEAELYEAPYLRVANVLDGSLDLTEIKTVSVTLSELRKHVLQTGDVLMTEGGDFDKLGRGFIWPGEIPSVLHQNHIFAVRTVTHLLIGPFLTLLTQSSVGRNYFTSTSVQSTNLASTNVNKVKQFQIPLPKIDEQEAIVDEVATVVSKLDQLDAQINLHMDRLNECRAALITNAVTGQLSVS